jgi:hypothetical protein
MSGDAVYLLMVALALEVALAKITRKVMVHGSTWGICRMEMLLLASTLEYTEEGAPLQGRILGKGRPARARHLFPQGLRSPGLCAKGALRSSRIVSRTP